MSEETNRRLGHTDEAEQDFAALLRVRPEFRLAEDVSPRVVKVFDNVRALTVGEVMVRLSPAGDIEIDRRTYRTHADARLDIFQYIEGWYNPHRRHSALGQKSPTNFENLYYQSNPKTRTLH